MSTIIERAPRTPAPIASRLTFWGGHTLTTFAALFLAFSGIIKLMNHPEAIKGTTQFGFPASYVVGIGVLEMVCLVLYLIPRTAVLGAILMTGYLGGAVATHLRAGGPMFNLIFPVLIGVLVWGGLFLRESRLRALMPVRR
jgi:hypothetical protein